MIRVEPYSIVSIVTRMTFKSGGVLRVREESMGFDDWRNLRLICTIQGFLFSLENITEYYSCVTCSQEESRDPMFACFRSVLPVFNPLFIQLTDKLYHLEDGSIITMRKSLLNVCLSDPASASKWCWLMNTGRSVALDSCAIDVPCTN